MTKSKEPGRSEAMLKKCHECSGEYEDGKVDCEVTCCPLYKWMPYKKKKPDFDWARYNPRAKGSVLKEDTKREITDEQRAAMAERLEKARAARGENADVQDKGDEGDS